MSCLFAMSFYIGTLYSVGSIQADPPRPIPGRRFDALPCKTNKYVCGSEEDAAVLCLYRASHLLRCEHPAPTLHSALSKLRSSSAVTALMPLDGGGLAAGTEASTVDLFNGSALQQGGMDVQPWAKLQTSGSVNALLPLDGGGLAAGTDASTVDLFNRSALRQGGMNVRPWAKLQTSAKVDALLPLDCGGLAAGTTNDTVELFNRSALRQGGMDVRPWAKLNTSGKVDALSPLDGGGLAAGTDASTVDLFNRSALQQGGMDVQPWAKLQTSAPVDALLPLDAGGLAVGTDAKTVDLFNRSALQQGGMDVQPWAKLQTSGTVPALLPLDGGGLVAGTTGSTVELFDGSALQQGGMEVQPWAKLQTSGSVYALLPLDGGGLAAGTDRTVDLFNRSSLKQGGMNAEPCAEVVTDEQRVDVFNETILQQAGIDNEALSSLDDPSLGVVREGIPALIYRTLQQLKIHDQPLEPRKAGADVDAWPEVQPWAKLKTSGAVYALSPLDGGGLAAATVTWPNTVDIFTASALQQGGMDVQPWAKLQTSGSVYALLPLDGGGLAAGTDASTVDLFNRSALQQGGMDVQPWAKLQTSSVVCVSLLPLDGGGLAAGTIGFVDLFNRSAIEQGGMDVQPWAKLLTSGEVHDLAPLDGGGLAVGSPYTVELFNESALQQGGLDVQPWASLQTSGLVSRLLPLEGGGLAAGTYVNTVDLFNRSALQQGGMGVQPWAKLQTSGYAQALLSRHSFTRSHTMQKTKSIVVNAAASHASDRLNDEVGIIALTAGQTRLSSFLSDDSIVLPSGVNFGDSFAIKSQRDELTCPAGTYSVRGDSESCDSCPQDLSSSSGQAFCAYPRWYWLLYAHLAGLPLCFCAFGVLICKRRTSQNIRAGLLFDAFQDFSVTSHQVVDLFRALSIILLYALWFCGATFGWLVLVNRMSADIPFTISPIGLIHSDSGIGVALFVVTILFLALACCLKVTLGLARHEGAPQLSREEFLGVAECCKWKSNVLRVCKRLFQSWPGMHAMVIANGGQALVSLIVQFAGAGRSLGSRDIVAAVAMVLALSSMLGALFSIVADRHGKVVDRHFRSAILLKNLLIFFKVAFLAMPNSEDVQSPKDLRYIWSCAEQSSCPDWCGVALNGTCLYNPPNAHSKASCVCAFNGAKESWQQYVLVGSISCSIILASCVLLSSSMDVCRHRAESLQRRTRGNGLVAILCHAVTNISVQVCTVVLVLDAHDRKPSLANDFFAVLQIGSGCIVLALFTNEAKWMLESTVKTRRLHGRNPYGGGMLVVRPITVVGALISFNRCISKDTNGKEEARRMIIWSALLIGSIAAFMFPKFSPDVSQDAAEIEVQNPSMQQLA